MAQQVEYQSRTNVKRTSKPLVPLQLLRSGNLARYQSRDCW